MSIDFSSIFTTVHEDTGLYDIAFNTLFVIGKIRHGFLIQAIDYGEKICDSYTQISHPITHKIIQSLYKFQYLLKFVYHDQGIFVVNQDTNFNYFTDEFLDTSKGQGEMISYPCAGDLYKSRNFTYHVTIYYMNESWDIMSVLCSKDADLEFEKIKNNMNRFLETQLKIDYELVVKKKRSYNLKQLITQLKKNEIDEDIQDNLESVIANTSIICHLYYQKKLNFKTHMQIFISLIQFFIDNGLSMTEKEIEDFEFELFQ